MLIYKQCCGLGDLFCCSWILDPNPLKIGRVPYKVSPDLNALNLRTAPSKMSPYTDLIINIIWIFNPVLIMTLYCTYTYQSIQYKRDYFFRQEWEEKISLFHQKHAGTSK